ncbi:MAG: tRNA pseudouridine(55) synthase TruB [Burkholderiaceae bacterium]|nr:tRNA pseudouridine(55) synthase TruB [Microbacteriaceae bacterium]
MTTASGILLLDKPAGITSHDAVSRTRKLADTRKVGHAGTLDPMATGLLVLGINSSTRLLTFVVGLDKEYFATIRLGSTTITDDHEGDLLDSAPAGAVAAVTEEAIARGIAELTGDIDQVPSAVSAIKVDGRRSYALVRAGETVELRSRAVTVAAFELLDVRLVTEGAAIHLDLDVRVECSSGTYIRALARDLGTDLGVGGHLTALRRTRIGPFRIADAATLESMDVAASLRSPADVASTLFPTVDLDTQQVVDLTHGKRIVLDGAAERYGARPVAALGPDGRLVGLLDVAGPKAKPIVNFPTSEVLA